MTGIAISTDADLRTTPDQYDALTDKLVADFGAMAHPLHRADAERAMRDIRKSFRPHLINLPARLDAIAQRRNAA